MPGNRRSSFLRKGAMPLCLALLLNGCSVISYRTCPSFVPAYEHLYAIHLQEWSDHERFLLIYGDSGYNLYAFSFEGEKKEVYDALCTKHNDLNYPHRVGLMNTHIPTDDIFIDTDFVSVSLVADADYDAAHPAGADLSDIVRFFSCSPYPFIKSGYSTYYHFDAGEFPEGVEDIWSWYMLGASEKLKPEWDNPYHLIDKRLEDLTAEDLTLLGSGWLYLIGFLYFEELPSVPGSYPMTVRMTTDSGEVFEDGTTMTF